MNESDKRTSLAMNFLLEYGKGAGNGALPVPSPYSRNKCKKCDHHSIKVNFSIRNISAGNGSPHGICKFARMLSVISDISHALCPLPVFLVIVILR